MLASLLDGYHDRNYVVQGFTHGFDLGIDCEKTIKSSSPTCFARNELFEKLGQELEKGYLLGPFDQLPLEDLVTSPICVVPKSNGKWRLIFNLSDPVNFSVNDAIPEAKKTVQYCSVNEVATFIARRFRHLQPYLSKIDLKDAYRMVPIKKDQWKYLGMNIRGQYLIDRCLPMGAASSCQIFQRISDSIKWMVTNSSPSKIIIFNYLDDFLLLAKNQSEGILATNHFLIVAEKLGLPISHDKVTFPTQSITFLGVGLNTATKSLYIPPEKVHKAKSMLGSFLDQKRPKIGLWQKLLGTLCHLAQVIPAGRAHLNYLYGTLQGILSSQKNLRRRVSASARIELQLWQSFLNNNPGRPFRMVDNAYPADFKIVTDASQSFGYGAVFGEQWFWGAWPDKTWSQLNIAFLELYPIYAAIKLWEDHFSGHTVVVKTDNHALVSVINKLHAKNSMLNQLTKKLALLCMTSDIHLIAHHLAGNLNTKADMLSRGQISDFRKKFPQMNSQPTLLAPSLLPESLNNLICKA